MQVTSADGSPITYEAARSHKRVFQTRFQTGQIKFGETGAAFLATIRSGIGWDPLSFGPEFMPAFQSGAFDPKDGVIGRHSLWIDEDFWVLRFRLMVKRGPW